MFMKAVLVYYSLLGLSQALCPHKIAALKRWSHSTTWPGNRKPSRDSRVVITDNVLLDETPPPLHSVTIETNGRLVWSPEGEYNLTTQYVMVKGRFDIGSDDCKFNRKAQITLTGIRGKYRYKLGHHLFGEKFIGVGPGGTLELHGREKLSWTKLTKTLPELTSENGIQFDHQSSNYSKDGYYKEGIHAYVLDGRTGAVIRFGTFYLGRYNTYSYDKDPQALADMIHDAKNGDIVLLGVKTNIIEPKVNITPVYEAVETLTDGHVTGTGLIRKVKKGDTYAFIMQKGLKSSQDERIGVNYKQASVKAEATFTTKHYKFSVSSYIDNVHTYNNKVNFRVVTSRAAYPTINVVDDVTSWQPGDKVIITSTDYHWRQVEEATVVSCAHCNSHQLQIALEAKYTHWGEMIHGVDQRAEVALLTRNILIQGQIENTCPPSNGNCNKYHYDTYGGHLKIVKGFKDTHIEGVEFYHMGQQSEKGFYPIHFHMTHDVDVVGNYSNPAWVRHNSIHHTFSRCVTVHGTHGATVADNVAYDHLGHCYFLEDGGEKRTVFDGNLGVATKTGSILPSDAKPATFWMTSPQVYMRNNVAAGGDSVGIWFVYPDEPMGPSAGLGFFQRFEAKHTAITEFNNNVAHSYPNSGLFIDNIILPNERVDGNNHYDARVDPLNTTSAHKEVLLYRLTAYKNGFQNAWVRGGLIRMDRASFSDSSQALTLARVSASQSLSNSVIIGESENIGVPTKKYNGSGYITMPRSVPLDYDLHNPINGFIFYDGPVYLKNIWFSGFHSNVNYTSGAIGFHRKNMFSSSPADTVTNVKFDFVDANSTGNRLYDGDEGIYGFADDDGDKTATLRDVDGSLTGYPGATIVKPGPYYENSRCYFRDNWNLEVCPQKFGSLTVTLSSMADHGKSHPFAIRDDKPHVRLTETWEYSAAFPVVLGGHISYTIHWDGLVPHDFSIVGSGIEKDQWVRVGVCLPRDGKFHLSLYKPVYRDTDSKYDPWTVASSLTELEKDTTGGAYYWDHHTGLMFFKLLTPNVREDVEADSCPGGCPYVHIRVLSGNMHDGDCHSRAYGPYTRAPITNQRPLHKQALPATASQPPKDWGAGSTRPFLTRRPVGGQYNQWSGWTHCSNTCGGGLQTRYRSCDSTGSSKDCQQVLVEHRYCNAHSCPKHAILG